MEEFFNSSGRQNLDRTRPWPVRGRAKAELAYHQLGALWEIAIEQHDRHVLHGNRGHWTKVLGPPELVDEIAVIAKAATERYAPPPRFNEAAPE
jgi:hypothetical protein